MSSTLTLHGTLTFPPGRLKTWRDGGLTIDDDADADDDSGCFSQPNDVDSVRAVLESDDECWPFVRFIVDGDVLHVRAALGDDCWSTWCGRIRALVAAAAEAGATGFVDAEDDGCYAGRLEIRRRQLHFAPPAHGRVDTKDRAGEADVYRILQEVLEQEMAAAKKKTAKKKTAKKKTAKKKTAKKSPAPRKRA